MKPIEMHETYKFYRFHINNKYSQIEIEKEEEAILDQILAQETIVNFNDFDQVDNECNARNESFENIENSFWFVSESLNPNSSASKSIKHFIWTLNAKLCVMLMTAHTSAAHHRGGFLSEFY